jgi:hypothetical protein
MMHLSLRYVKVILMKSEYTFWWSSLLVVVSNNKKAERQVASGGIACICVVRCGSKQGKQNDSSTSVTHKKMVTEIDSIKVAN